jgi:hypothetical protein
MVYDLELYSRSASISILIVIQDLRKTMTLANHVSVATLKHMDVAELMALFSTLDAPTIHEMNGEYAATLLKQPSLVATVVGYAAIYNPIMPGLWLCKAFRPVSNTQGRGYNTFQHLGNVVQRYPMQTLIAASRYDGKPAYQSLCGTIHMVDEVRKVSDGVYLGIGTYGFTNAQRHIPLPFLLTGSVSAYRGDIGDLRQHFNLSKELPALFK